MGLVGKGAEAELRDSELAGTPGVLKDRIKKKYRIPQIDIPLRRKRTRTEAKLLSLAKKALVKVPLILMLSEFGVTMSKIDGKLLRDVKLTSKLLRTAGEYLGRLHSAGIVHGDYTPANLMVDGKGELYVIDFGLGSLSNDLEDKAVDILLMKKSLGSTKDFSAFLGGYKKENAESAKVLGQLAEVEKRGRYVVRAMQG
jgi:Kae1-associated kinase Bud32